MSCPRSAQSIFRIRRLYFSFKDTVGAELNFFTNSFLSSAAFSDIDGSPFGPRIPCSARAGTVNKTTNSNNKRSSGRCPTNIFSYALFLDGKVVSESTSRRIEKGLDPTSHLTGSTKPSPSFILKAFFKISQQRIDST